MSKLHNIPISIAEMLIDVSSSLSLNKLGIIHRLGPFIVGAAGRQCDHITLRCEDNKCLRWPSGKLIYNPGSVWRMYQCGQKYSAVITCQNRHGQTELQGVLHANDDWNDLRLIERSGGTGWQSLINKSAGELIFRTRILFSGGLVLHASGIDDNGHGIVFAGHSGAGKSTQLGLWRLIPGVFPMNDDRMAIRVHSGGVNCYSTPWDSSRKMARNHVAPLSAIVLLEQAPHNEIHLLRPSAAAPLLAARAFLPYWNGELMQRAFSNLNALLSYVPVYCLRCRPEPEAISTVRSVL